MAIVSVPEQAAVAASVFRSRRDRASHPNGSFDKGGRWFPSADEQQACCSRIRTPSRAWPYSLMLHCRTAEHVAQLYGADLRLVKRAARES